MANQTPEFILSGDFLGEESAASRRQNVAAQRSNQPKAYQVMPGRQATQMYNVIPPNVTVNQGRLPNPIPTRNVTPRAPRQYRTANPSQVRQNYNPMQQGNIRNQIPQNSVQNVHNYTPRVRANSPQVARQVQQFIVRQPNPQKVQQYNSMPQQNQMYQQNTSHTMTNNTRQQIQQITPTKKGNLQTTHSNRISNVPNYQIQQATQSNTAPQIQFNQHLIGTNVSSVSTVSSNQNSMYSPVGAILSNLSAISASNNLQISSVENKNEDDIEIISVVKPGDKPAIFIDLESDSNSSTEDQTKTDKRPSSKETPIVQKPAPIVCSKETIKAKVVENIVAPSVPRTITPLNCPETSLTITKSLPVHNVPIATTFDNVTSTTQAISEKSTLHIPKLFCLLCSFNTDNMHKLDFHMILIHQHVYKCKKCSAFFTSSFHAHSHFVFEHSSKKIEIAVLNLKNSAKWHYIKNMCKDLLICEVCYIEFTDVVKLSKHMKQNHSNSNVSRYIKFPFDFKIQPSLKALPDSTSKKAEPDFLYECVFCTGHFFSLFFVKLHFLNLHPDMLPKFEVVPNNNKIPYENIEIVTSSNSLKCSKCNHIDYNEKNHAIHINICQRGNFKCGHCDHWEKDDVDLKKHNTKCHKDLVLSILVRKSKAKNSSPDQCPRFKCYYCNFWCFNISELIYHHEIIHLPKELPFKYFTFSQYIDDEPELIERGVFSCKNCSISPGLYDTIKEHAVKIHGKEDIEEKKEKVDLKNIYTGRQWKVPYDCLFCKFDFSQLLYGYQHHQIFHSNKFFQFPLQHKRFFARDSIDDSNRELIKRRKEEKMEKFLALKKRQNSPFKRRQQKSQLSIAKINIKETIANDPECLSKEKEAESEATDIEDNMEALEQEVNEQNLEQNNSFPDKNVPMDIQTDLIAKESLQDIVQLVESKDNMEKSNDFIYKISENNDATQVEAESPSEVNKRVTPIILKKHLSPNKKRKLDGSPQTPKRDSSPRNKKPCYSPKYDQSPVRLASKIRNKYFLNTSFLNKLSKITKKLVDPTVSEEITSKNLIQETSDKTLNIKNILVESKPSSNEDKTKDSSKPSTGSNSPIIPASPRTISTETVQTISLQTGGVNLSLLLKDFQMLPVNSESAKPKEKSNKPQSNSQVTIKPFNLPAGMNITPVSEKEGSSTPIEKNDGIAKTFPKTFPESKTKKVIMPSNKRAIAPVSEKEGSSTPIEKNDGIAKTFPESKTKKAITPSNKRANFIANLNEVEDSSSLNDDQIKTKFELKECLIKLDPIMESTSFPNSKFQIKHTARKSCPSTKSTNQNMCFICNFEDESLELDKHMFQNHEASFKCSTCTSYFAYSYLAEEHFTTWKGTQQKHSIIKLNPLSFDELYAKEDSLVKYFICEVCNFKAKSQKALKEHFCEKHPKETFQYVIILSDQSIDPVLVIREHYKCSLCECIFYSHSEMESHWFDNHKYAVNKNNAQVTQSPNKPFQSCSKCSFSTSSHYIIQDHLKNYHSTESITVGILFEKPKETKTFPCLKCAFKGYTSKDLIYHFKLFHCENFSCSACQSKYVDEFSALDHLDEMHVSDIAAHILIHSSGEEPLPLEQCEKFKCFYCFYFGYDLEQAKFHYLYCHALKRLPFKCVKFCKDTYEVINLKIYYCLQCSRPSTFSKESVIFHTKLSGHELGTINILEEVPSSSAPTKCKYCKFYSNSAVISQHHFLCFHSLMED